VGTTAPSASGQAPTVLPDQPADAQQKEELLILQVREKKGQTGTGVVYMDGKMLPPLPGASFDLVWRGERQDRNRPLELSLSSPRRTSRAGSVNDVSGRFVKDVTGQNKEREGWARTVVLRTQGQKPEPPA